MTPYAETQRARVLFAVSLALAGCASSTARAPDAAAPTASAPEPAVEPAETKEVSPALEEGPMDIDRARRVVAELEAQWPLADDHPLRNPKTLDEAEQILKLDQVRLFPFAIEYLGSQQGADALALRGQIELAWGEAYVLLMELLGMLKRDFAAQRDALEALQSPSPEDQQRLDWLIDNLRYMEPRMEAFKHVAIDHISKGSQVADQIIADKPESYLGYRLAADYYRTLRDWESFATMVEKIKETNPDSNGLLFLLGAASFQKEADLEAAEGYYRRALTNDPKFVRAQAHLVIIQSEIQRTHEELLALEALNPDHQFVVIAGDSIKKAVRSGA